MIENSEGSATLTQDAKFVIIGLGSLGQSLALALLERGRDVLGIDRDPVLARRLSSRLPCRVLDATDEAAWREVNIAAYDAAIVTIRSDFESNLLATVTLKRLGVPYIVSRTTKDYQREILIQAGADRVVEPESDAGLRLARELTTPVGSKRLTVEPSRYISVVEVPPSRQGKTLDDLLLPSGLEITVLAIQRGDESLVQPPADTILLDGDLLVVMANTEATGVSFLNQI